MNDPDEEFFGAERLTDLLDEVDAELGAGEPVEIVACRGAAMAFKYDIRSTSDVDVISEPFPEQLKQAVREVAARNGLGERWINDAAKISIPKLAPRIETIYEGKRLKVLSPGPHFLLAMKLAAGRERDLEDAALLVKEIGFDSAEEVLDLVEEAWGHTQMSMSVVYHTQKVFELAYDDERSPPNDPQRFSQPSRTGPDLDIGL